MKSAKTIFWFLRFGGSLIKVYPRIRKAGKLKKTGDYRIYKPYVDKLVLDWMLPLVKSAGVNYLIEGGENIPKNESVLFVANHQGVFDFPAIVSCLNGSCAYIVKKEADSLPVVNNCMRLMDCIYIDRQNARNALKSLDEAAYLINNGRSVMMFPEGTRSKTGEIGEFKNGAYKIIEKTRCKVVPVLIDGTRRAFEETGNIRPSDVRVRIFSPIETKDMTRQEIKLLMPEVREMLVKEKNIKTKTRS